MSDKQKYYWIYILLVANGHYYTGYTNNLTRRYKEHISGKASCKYTRSFRPVGIKQCWQVYETQGIAMKIERFIKSKTRKIKEEIISNPKRLKQIVYKLTGLKLKIRPYNVLKSGNLIK